MVEENTVQDVEHQPQPAAWIGIVADFLTASPADLLSSLRSHHQACMNSPASLSQDRAWRTSLSTLRDSLAALTSSHPCSLNWGIVLEYELPRERGRRPDVVLLAGEQILILEFKDMKQALRAHLDQVAAYARDIGSYHAASHERRIIPLLVLTQSHQSITAAEGEVRVASSDSLITALASHATPVQTQVDPHDWAAADYVPLPSLVAAARRIFEHEPLPQIRRAQSAGIPQTIEYLAEVTRRSQANGERHIALVTGVPGAGKTLVGLQFVYTNHFGDEGSSRTAVFLSGNGPLVKVLQHALRSSVFVQDVHGFLKQYGGATGRVPEEHVWVYDEAQRAWDAQRVQDKRGHGLSEPQDFVGIGERQPSWALIVGLIGEGQEIHLGEEAGLVQWDEAVATGSQPWHVHCPQKVAHFFGAAAQVHEADVLDLTTTLRSHLAEDVHRWVAQLLGGDLAGAALTGAKMHVEGFCAYVTRDLEAAKSYVRERYAGELDKRYGLIASSKGKNLGPHGIITDWSFTKNLREGPWYNDPPDARDSCCQLREVATEFACQGLELDFPIVGWGSDLTWAGSAWISPPQPRSKARDPHQLRVNSYRVLLTRGRDGMIVFVPPETSMNGTYEALMEAGLTQFGRASQE
ncbi:MAG: DUF2075 domain-containing protein [Armatimonadota bacterium]